MLSNALKKSFNSVYEPNAYKKLYQLMIGFFIKDYTLVNYEFEVQLKAICSKSGNVTDIQ